MELTSKQKGNLTELQCLTAFYEQGCHVSLPYGENSRYDMIVDVNGILLRVQVKTSSLKHKDDDTAFMFSCRSSHVNSQGVIISLLFGTINVILFPLPNVRQKKPYD